MTAAIRNAVLDLATEDIRTVNKALRSAEAGAFSVLHPNGAHAIAAGLRHPIDVTIAGHAGYYTAGMNMEASVTIEGTTGTGVAENMMSGTVRVTGSASQSAGATAHGGLLVIEGDAAARCGISLKGGDIVVGGSVGAMSAFMAQAGTLVVCGDAGEALGDSLYEARLFVAGTVRSLGADCEEKPMTEEDLAHLTALLDQAGLPADPADFRRYGSARTLYNFHVDDAW